MLPTKTNVYFLAVLFVLIYRHVWTGSNHLFLFESIWLLTWWGLRQKSKAALISSWLYSIILAVLSLGWAMQLVVQGNETDSLLLKSIGWSLVLLAVVFCHIAVYFIFDKHLASYVAPVDSEV